jgi:hypothetical protein
MLIYWRTQHHFGKDMELFMGSSIVCFRILSLDTKGLKTSLAKIIIKALIALVSHIFYGRCATPVAFY